MEYVSRAGKKLEFALNEFQISLDDLICADLGCSTGGFTDCMLQHNAKKVYSVDTGYGVIDWKLRNNPNVVVMERTNSLHVVLPEKMDFISIDVGWTRQHLILPYTLTLLKEKGTIISLLKPHYEADRKHLKMGRVIDEHLDEVVDNTINNLKDIGIRIDGIVRSPVLGEKGKNIEYLIKVSSQ